MNHPFIWTAACAAALLASSAHAEKCSDFTRNLLGDEGAAKYCDPDPGYKARMEKLDRTSEPALPKPSSAILASPNSTRPPNSFLETAEDYCMEFDQTSSNLVETFMNKLVASPYPLEAYFHGRICHVAQYVRSIKAPMLHMVIDAPATREEFPETVYLYFIKRRKDPDGWLKAVNAKNDMGETFLDYVETRIKSGKISSAATMEAAINIRNFACSKGAVYSKYTDKKCP